ncbi:hypothetical protein [Ideonella paludis]|uniref:Topoisomerase II n=1 Tax=Ideonella paludis TaxID=1233411 RepID=A0ABS5DSP2_9BURK|nr:hypothetical protein [Ideonella paludis]MBQ0934164.1 hypothetical protein [Ideonella paludis]
MNQIELESQLNTLDEWIRQNQAPAIARFSSVAKKPCSVHVMHAHLGKNNNTFVDSVRTQFLSPEDFISKWIEGLHGKLAKIQTGAKRRYEGKIFSEEILFEALQDDLLREYTFKFLTRNFYRNFQARIRSKPNEELWSIWFGAGNLCWGLVISPTRRNEEWTNDKSQMRRESYHYWTIGHVLATGLIDPTSPEPVSFANISEFAVFYRSILKRVSNSLYEQAIYDKYIDYIKASTQPSDVPLLIPELRYAGKEKMHEHRLDFSVLNVHTSTLTGFELSPASTHISVAGIKDKTQVAVNAQLAKDWEKEVDKRNDYFEKYGITTITFADRDLKDVDSCFSKIKYFLDQRAKKQVSISEALNNLSKLRINKTNQNMP